MEEPSDFIFEEREELMVSPSGEKNPIFRIAHFLIPSVSKQRDDTESYLCKKTISKQKESKIKVHFRGWRHPKKEWRSWVEKMETKHKSTWKRSGIHEAIMGSVYKIKKNKKFLLGLIEKWSPETNTFIFPWGEATLTLEDMKVLGGFSVLGDSVLTKLVDQECVEIEKKLVKGVREAGTVGTHTATGFAWLSHFMGSGSDIEHEAFLSLWLSWYVFPTGYYHIGKHVFTIAILLARGTKIALAPPVLSSLYRDMWLLKEKIMASEDLIEKHEFIVRAPFQILQLWAWERFPKLGPKPLTDVCNPRLARWHNVRTVAESNFSSAIDSAGESFKWRPYASSVDYWLSGKFNLEKEQWVLVDKDLDEELETLARCLRVSELVGLDCIEQYLPHRVSRQFGMDQDIPGLVARSCGTRCVAWSNYTRPIRDAKLYIPSKHFDSGVTIRYSKWWNHSTMKQSFDAIKPCVKRPRNTKRCPRRFNAEIKTTTSHSRNLHTIEARKEIELANAVETGTGSCNGNISTSNADCVVVEDIEPASKSVICKLEEENEAENIPGLELEHRISRLERVIGMLKETKYAHLF